MAALAQKAVRKAQGLLLGLLGHKAELAKGKDPSQPLLRLLKRKLSGLRRNNVGHARSHGHIGTRSMPHQGPFGDESPVTGRRKGVFLAHGAQAE